MQTFLIHILIILLWSDKDADRCTTNAITPVLKAMEDTYGVKSGHLETIHAYTNDQNLVDNFHTCLCNVI